MRLVAAAVLAVLAAVPAPVRAQDGVLSGTLKTVLDRGTLRLGVRDGAVPFSFRNPGGQAVGFSVDLCLGIAADVAAAVNMDLLEPDAPAWRRGLRVEYVPVAPDARLPKVVAGDVDLECGSTTATAERAKTVAFSPVFFLAGTKLMAAVDGGVASYRDLAGKTVVVSAGTTNGEVVRTLAKRGAPAFTVAEAPDLPAAYAMLAGNQVAALASDDILLAGLAATRPDGKRLRLVGDYLSYEPYALIYRRDDPAFAELVTSSFQRLAQSGMLRASYNRWFTDRLPTGETLNLPMSPQLTEMFRALGAPD